MTLSLALPLQEPDAACDPFDQLFRRYHLRLCALAGRRFPTEDREEIAQEAMLRLLLTFERYDPRRDPWPYLATICINVGRDLADRVERSRTRDVEPADLPHAPPADEPVLLAEQQQWVGQVLSCLRPGLRRILALYAVEGMRIGEIADLLGCSDLAVRQQLFRARREARLLLSGLDDLHDRDRPLADRNPACAPLA